jgi:5'(3')-deoxyribonucleotidase
MQHSLVTMLVVKSYLMLENIYSWIERLCPYVLYQPIVVCHSLSIAFVQMLYYCTNVFFLIHKLLSSKH